MTEQGGDLNGGRAAGEGQQPVGRRVAGQIDKNVDAVIPDEIGESGVGEADGWAPVIGMAAKPCGDFIFDANLGIAEYFDLRVIVRGQQRFREERDGMVAKVWRNVADP